MTAGGQGPAAQPAPARQAARRMPAYVGGRFGAGWLVGELGGRLFVGGGAVRAALECAVHGGEWEPKDLDVFALDRAAADRAIGACEAAGGSARADGDLVWRLLSRGCSQPIDLVLYELGQGADIPTALWTFDFNVSSVGWDGGAELIFPPGKGPEILRDIAARRARVGANHVFLRRPIRAIRRLNSIIEKGYEVSQEDLQVYLANFVRKTNDPGVRNLSRE